MSIFVFIFHIQDTTLPAVYCTLIVNLFGERETICGEMAIDCGFEGMGKYVDLTEL
jgi:hypothetical protein